MEIAIDIRGGRCVRLSQGRDDARTDYYKDPVEPAVVFAQAGTSWIHVVDLDGALFTATMMALARRVTTTTTMMMATTMAMATATARWATARRDMTTTTMATGDDGDDRRRRDGRRSRR